jgi:hypothetical protein
MSKIADLQQKHSSLSNTLTTWVEVHLKLSNIVKVVLRIRMEIVFYENAKL